MKKSKALDLTNGEPMRLLILFAIPMLIGGVFQLFYNMVDTIVLGKFVSAEALASVGATGSTFSMFMLAGNAVTNAVSILISQSWGAKDMKQVKKTVAHSIFLTVVVAVAFGLIAFLAAGPLMRLLGTPENIIAGSITYIQITCGLCLASLLYNVSSSILRSIGDSRTPLYFLILCSLLNIALDLLFVVAFDNGVAGVAWATIISQAISAILCLTYMWRKYPDLRIGREQCKLEGPLLKSFGGIAIPMLLQNLSLSIGMLVITGVINSFGSDIVAAYTVGSKVESLVVVAFSQFAFSFSVYSGQNFGAKKYDRIGLGMKKAATLILSLVFLSMIVMFAFAKPLAQIFVDAEINAFIIENAVNMIHTEACFLPALGLIWLVNSCLRGIGAITPTIVSSMVELVSKIALSILLSMALGAMGIWLAAPIGWVLGLITSSIYYFFGGWKKKALEADARAEAAKV